MSWLRKGIASFNLGQVHLATHNAYLTTDPKLKSSKLGEKSVDLPDSPRCFTNKNPDISLGEGNSGVMGKVIHHYQDTISFPDLKMQERNYLLAHDGLLSPPP